MLVKDLHGSCLCGGVQFEINGKIGPVGQCHCSKCRKVSGTDGNAVFYTSTQSFNWVSGESEIKSYPVPGGNGWASRFCGTCGSPTPHTDKAQKFYFVPAGLLDNDPGFRGYAAHIYVGSKAPWAEISDNAPKYEEGFESRRVG